MFPALALLLDLALVALLGADAHDTRQFADAALVIRSYHARIALEAGCRSDDVEVRHRCRSLREAALGALVDTFPAVEIDAAYYHVPRWWSSETHGYDPHRYPEAYRTMRPYLDLAGGADPPPWENYYAATRLWLRDCLEAGDDVEGLRVLVEDMRRRDSVFLWRYWHREQSR